MSEAFIKHLWSLDRAALAELRRAAAFDVGAYAGAYPFVEPFTAPLERRWDRDAHYLVATLFALTERPLEPGHAPPAPPADRTLGHALAELHAARDFTPSIEARFVALLDADDEQLPNRLRHAMSLLRADGISVPWASLLRDVLAWNHPDRVTQRRWARAFYQRAATTEAPIAPAATAE